MKRKLLTCLGTGDGWPCPHRHHSAFYYELGGVEFLLDAGEPVSRTFNRLGRGYEVTEGIVISHMHGDHVGGLLMLLQSFWLEGRQRPLTVHLPADGIEPIRGMLRAACIFDELVEYELRFEPLSAGRAIRWGETVITPFETTHLASLRRRYEDRYPMRYESFSFLIEAPGVRVGHTADVGAPEDLAPLVSDPLDLLLCEFAHFAPEALFRYLQGRSITHLALTHVGRSQMARIDEYRRMAVEMLPEIRVSFVEDGQRLEL